MSYTPKTWTLADPIAKTDLDHIETGIEDAHTLTAGTITWDASFTDSGSTLVKHDATGLVTLALWFIRVSGSSVMDELICTLPTGYRPADTCYVAAASEDGFARLLIDPDGSVHAETAGFDNVYAFLAYPGNA